MDRDRAARPRVRLVGRDVRGDAQPAGRRRRTNTVNLFTWFPAGALRVNIGFLTDPLSVTWILLVTGVGSLIHLYAIGYMHGDPRFTRFFAYLNLFAASMLILVLGSSFLVTFLGWEGVGLCSYLLISHWFERDRAAVAGKKAFVANRVGDFGFMLAMFFIIGSVGSLDYSAMNLKAGSLPHTTVTAIALLPVRRVHRQERADPAARLAARRDGGPDPGLGADPRRDDGHRRRLPAVPRAPVLRGERRRADRRRLGRCRHRAARGHRRARPTGHQTGAGVLDDQPARLHVPRLRARRVPGRGLHGASRTPATRARSSSAPAR